MECADLAKAPVRQVHRILVLSRELRAVAEGGARWRAGADVHHRAETVKVVIGPFGIAVAKAEFRPADDMIDACRAVPGIADVPFHIRVVREEFTDFVEG